MLSFASSVRVFLAVEATDMRKGFEGLYALASERLAEDVRSGALFVFTNKRHTRLKMLYFDGTGLWLMTKRLEEGTIFMVAEHRGRTGEVEADAGSLGDVDRWN